MQTRDITFRLTPSDALRNQMRPFLTHVFRLTFIFAAVVALYFVGVSKLNAPGKGESSSLVAVVLTVGVIVAGLLVGYVIYMFFVYLRRYASEWRIVVRDSGVEVTGGGADAVYAWHTVESVERDDRYIRMRTTSDKIIAAPKHAFPDASAAEEFYRAVSDRLSASVFVDAKSEV
ncbi:MAG: hypothetical protein GF419_00805 [Ignavibacteriales bacterium]|nr:hypothetical protein [Ignavibacteriales bacterium]